MPRATDAKYNILATKPENVDRYWIYDIDADEQKVQEYGTLKGLFVKTDENSTVSARIEMQSGFSFDWGSAAEYKSVSDGTDFTLTGTPATGKMIFKPNSTEMFSLDAGADQANISATTFNFTGSTVKIGTAELNRDGTPGDGVAFGALGKFLIKKGAILEAGANIEAGANYYSRDGTNNGMSVNPSHDFTFSDKLNVTGVTNLTGVLNCTSQINANKTGNYSLRLFGNMKTSGDIETTGYINRTGAAFQGLTFDGSNSAVFTKIANFNSGIDSGDDINVFGTKNYKHGGNNGLSTTVNFSTYAGILTFSGGILTGKT